MKCRRCGCSHPPFAANEVGEFDPDCFCTCHQVRIMCTTVTDNTTDATSQWHQSHVWEEPVQDYVPNIVC